MTNIPESVMNAFKEDAERLYPVSTSTDLETQKIENLVNGSMYSGYISGRQDEWVKQQKEIAFRMKLLKEHFFNVQRLAMPDENLTDEILESCFRVYCIEHKI